MKRVTVPDDGNEINFYDGGNLVAILDLDGPTIRLYDGSGSIVTLGNLTTGDFILLSGDIELCSGDIKVAGQWLSDVLDDVQQLKDIHNI